LNDHTLIVGGTKGIGRTVAKILHDEGYRISVISRQESFDRRHALDGVNYWKADTTHKKNLSAAIEKIAQRHDGLDHLVFLQRYRGRGDGWTGEMETGLTGTKNTIELAKPYFSQSKNQSITVISSIAAGFIVDEQPAGYHVTKAGLNHLMRFYAVELGPKGIRVNSISPGTTVKEESKAYYRENPKIPSLIERITPLGRMGTAKDVAQLVSFLCSRKASFLTGNNIRLDGGISLHGQESLARQLLSSS
jgi:NAD(P)-dependent dehydrogenase (short-subunit alcohol dehydrogenase family)